MSRVFFYSVIGVALYLTTILLLVNYLDFFSVSCPSFNDRICNNRGVCGDFGICQCEPHLVPIIVVKVLVLGTTWKVDQHAMGMECVLHS